MIRDLLIHFCAQGVWAHIYLFTSVDTLLKMFAILKNLFEPNTFNLHFDLIQLLNIDAMLCKYGGIEEKNMTSMH